MVNDNILSKRYATEDMNIIFSELERIKVERDLWILVLKIQKQLGVKISTSDILKLERARNEIDMKDIFTIEKRTKHDLKARLEYFIKVSGASECIHKGMTSCDITDNTSQILYMRAGRVILGKYASILRHMVEKIQRYKNTAIVARTHHQPAQLTVLGRRFTMWAEELLLHTIEFERFLDIYPFRGIKGPIGTQFDMLTLFDGDFDKVQALEYKIANYFGFNTVLDSPGQIYPRSLDYALVSGLSRIASACENFAKGMRLMSGYELVTEGFKEGQVGSSAMPHKMNTRSSERVCGFAELLKMYADGASRLSGDQWEEGDVSCSVVRRVIVPDAFYASDGLCETTLTILNEMGAYPAVIDNELERFLPFLATTEILMKAVRAGVGRERAHELIKKHAVAEALRMREEGGGACRLAELLSRESVFEQANITRDSIESILADKEHFVGNADMQMDSIVCKINKFLQGHSKSVIYEPGSIL